jgi:hypothetical protein
MWVATNSDFTELILLYGNMSPVERRWTIAIATLQNPEQYLWLLGPPLCVLIAGGFAVWAISGFSDRSAS